MSATADVKTLPLSERIQRIEISATLAVVNEAEKLRATGADLVDFGAGEPHFATPQHIKDAAVAALAANFTRYTAVAGTAELRDAIVRLAHQRGIYVISDECYVYLNFAGKPFSAGSLTDCKEHLVVIGSLSKTYAMTGWRLGYALAPAPLVSAMQKLQSQSTSNPTSIVQKAAVAALTGPQECVAEMRADYIRLRDQIVAGLRGIPGIRCTQPEGAFYAYPNVSHYFGRGGIQSAGDIAGRLLREASLVTVPGEGFGTRQHIRISYAASAAEIEKGLGRMRKFFGAL